MKTNSDYQKNPVKEDVLKTKYIRIISWFQCTISAWPSEELGQRMNWLSKCLRLFLPLQCLFLVTGEVHYMANTNLNFLEFGDTLISCFLTIIENVRFAYPLLKGYREMYRDFLMSFNLIHFKNKGIHFAKIHAIVDKVCYYWTLYIITVTFLAGFLFNVGPQYENFKNGVFSPENHNVSRYKYSVYFSYPYLKPDEHFNAISVINIWYTYCCAVSVSVMDLLMMVITFHIIGHITVLRKTLESIKGPEETCRLKLKWKKRNASVKYERYSKGENEKISAVLKECVHHHRFIIRFTDKVSHFLGAIIAIIYAFHPIACCTVLLEITRGGMHALIRFGPLTLLIFGQLIQISIIFEIVGTASEKLPDTLYSVPWECMDTRNQRTTCILLHRLQRTINVTAMGMTSVGVTTMAGVLKTSFSYYAFLRNTN